MVILVTNPDDRMYAHYSANYDAALFDSKDWKQLQSYFTNLYSFFLAQVEGYKNTIMVQ